jgi:flagellar assembly protein FliH
LSSTIVRDPEIARPWPPLSLRSASAIEPPVPTDADRESENAIAAARAEAEELLHSARLEAAELIRAAEETVDGLQAAARQAGEREAHEAWQKQRSQLADLAHSVGAAYQRFCLDQVPALAELATIAAERLLGEQLKGEPEQVVSIVRAAMEQVSGSTQVLLSLNPEDVELVQQGLACSPTGGAPAVQIRPDPSVGRGGCRIESEHGTVDGTVSGRLARLHAAMERGLEDADF